MRSIGLDCRSGIATAAVSLPVFMIGFCVIAIFASKSLPTLFTVLVITAVIGATFLAVLQCIWTKKTYIRRLQKTTRALEDISLGKLPAQLTEEKYVLCSDIKQCPENRTINDCLGCELYSAQSDLEKIGLIVNTIGGNIDRMQHRPKVTPATGEGSVIDLNKYKGIIRRDYGSNRPG